MESKLKKLFDYQKFEKNESLEKFISETEGRYAGELSDDSLSRVNAAGVPDLNGQQIDRALNAGNDSQWYGTNPDSNGFEPGSRFSDRWLNQDSQK